MVFQGAMNAFNPVQRIGHQIVEALELHDKAGGRAAHARCGELLELVGIRADRARRFPHEFSGGMRQRAAIAMALACEPQVLLADEPTTALDVMVQAQILQLLERALRRARARDRADHARPADRRADLPVAPRSCMRGAIAERGPTAALHDAPQHPYTRMLFAATPDLAGSGGVASIPGAPPRLDRPLVACPFAPRCDSAFETCRELRPPLIPVGEEHLAACHLAAGSAA